MDPFTLALLGGTALMGGVNAWNANSLAGQGLDFQKQQAALANEMGTAGKTDAYGDTTTYDPATNTWKTTLSPMQQAIANAQQSEQFKQATTDAARNRSIRQLMYNNALGAETDYNKARAGYEYDQPASQGALQDKLTTLMTNANNQLSSDNESAASRALLRQGRGDQLATLVNTIQNNRGKALAGDELNAYTNSINEEGQLQQQHASKYLPAIQQAAQTIAAGGGAPVNMDNNAMQLAGFQQQDAQGALQALLGGGSLANDAFKNASSIAQKTGPSLKDITSLYTALQKSPKAPGDIPITAQPGFGKGGTSSGGGNSYDQQGTGSSYDDNDILEQIGSGLF